MVKEPGPWHFVQPERFLLALFCEHSNSENTVLPSVVRSDLAASPLGSFLLTVLSSRLGSPAGRSRRPPKPLGFRLYPRVCTTSQLSPSSKRLPAPTYGQNTT